MQKKSEGVKTVNSTGLFSLAALVILIGLAGLLFVKIQVRQLKIQKTKRAEAKRLTLHLSPLYRQKVQEDRQYELAAEQLALDRARLNAETFLKQQELDLKRERQTVELALLRSEFELKRYLACTRVAPEQYLVDYEPQRITALPSLRRVGREAEKPSEDLLEAARYPQPSHDELVRLITPNSYTYSPGIHATTGEPVIVDLVKVPHLKIIGSTGFGKSCLCGSIIDQLTSTHDPRRLQIALLDLEHKTSRLYEDLPHVATLTVGKREVRMVATSADQCAEYLGYLYQHMKYREQLAPQDLYQLPIMLIYIEEMLALTHEVVDPKLLNLIFQSLLLLAVRARKYGMFLLAAMQLDYSTEAMKVNQKMFRFRGAAGVDPSAARAAGFTNNELIKQNFQQGQPGQFVIEFPGFSHLVISPVYDVEAKLADKFGYIPGFGKTPLEETPPEMAAVKPSRNSAETGLKTDETAQQARFQETRQLYEKGWGKVKIIEKIYGAKPGKSKKYLEAEAEYEGFLVVIEQSQEREQVRA
jgi:hypothetical protein